MANPDIMSWLDLDPTCPRIRGFWDGYNFNNLARLQHGPSVGWEEYNKGWHEGCDLLFDERRAAAEAKGMK